MSDYLVDQVIEQCEQYLHATEDPYLMAFEENIAEVESLSEYEKEDYIAKNYEYVDKYVRPVYEDCEALLQELRGTGKDLGGLANYGDLGKKYYAAIVREKSSSDLTPEELTDYLDDKIADLYNDLIAEYAKNPDAYNDFMNYMADFDDPNEVLEYINEKMTEDFAAPATTEYTIDYLNEAEENDSTVAYYITARIDDISHNSIKVNRSAISGDGTNLYTTLAHEGIPGHMYEFTMFFANTEIPMVRKVLDFIGATEGWAEYASECSVKYLDTSDSVKRFIQIDGVLNYAINARVDLGVNYEGWTKKDLQEYMSDYFEVDEASVEDMFYFVVGDPGMIIPYASGHLMMNDLRAKAEKELDDDFSLKDFNTFIVEKVGVAPFPIYESELEKWID